MLYYDAVITLSLIARICRNCDVSNNDGRAVSSALAELLIIMRIVLVLINTGWVKNCFVPPVDDLFTQFVCTVVYRCDCFTACTVIYIHTDIHRAELASF